MSFEGSGTSLSGSALFAAVVVVCGSLVAGYVVAEREIEVSGWPALCETEILEQERARLRAKRAPRPVIPERMCNKELDGLPPLFKDYRDAWNGVCGIFDNPDFNEEARKAEEKIQRGIDAANERRLDLVRSGATSQCGCAKNLYLQENMVPLALYTGSLRFVSLPAVENRDDELRRAVQSPACAGFTEAGQ